MNLRKEHQYVHKYKNLVGTIYRDIAKNDGDIGSPLDGESGLIGTKISGEFREDTALELSCIGSSQSKGYVITVECKENLEKSHYLRVEKEELENKVKEWKK